MVIHTNTGAPQGCVLSPVLFILYTNDCVSCNPDCSTVKFADDTALSSILFENEDRYKQEIERLIYWCNYNFLELNIKKTKELIIDFRRKTSDITPVIINGDIVETVEE